MKFIFDNDDIRLQGAVVEQHLYTHIRTCGSFEEYDRKFGQREGAWLSRGVNHRMIPASRWAHNPNGDLQWVARDEPRNVPVLDLDFEGLAKLLSEYEDLVVRKSSYADVPLEITVRD